jgi:hypothetical protein
MTIGWTNKRNRKGRKVIKEWEKRDHELFNTRERKEGEEAR